MARKPRLFISYRRETIIDREGIERKIPSRIVEQVVEKFKSSGEFEIFFDQNLVGGVAWTEKLMQDLSETDVLVLLLHSVEVTDENDEAQTLARLRSDTGWSDWVQREVDYARAEGITIYPIILNNPSERAFQASLERLNIAHIQKENLPPLHDEAAWKKLLGELKKGEEATYLRRRERLRTLQRRLANPPNIAPYKPSRSYSFRLDGRDLGVMLHIGTGNIADVRGAPNESGIDVIVNSENDYMQMARFHEPHAVSAALRLNGAKRRGAMQVEEDTVQMELDRYFLSLLPGEPPIYPYRPVGVGDVLITHAGHPKSRLAEHGVRYIFHAASVRLDVTEVERTIRPIALDQISQLVEHCLERIVELNAARGLDPVRFPGWSEREGDRYEPIDSIVFPVFGTGSGGAKLGEVIPMMLNGIATHVRFNHTKPDFSLKHIHICLYKESTLDDVLTLAEQYCVL
jgi:O-acetyl-ADP-ribose deacetylase (regulator of RNase III)